MGHSAIVDRLQLSLLMLERAGYSAGTPPTPAAIAKVLDEPVSRVEQVRAAIRRPSEVTADVLIPLVATVDLARAQRLLGEEVGNTPAEIASWLCKQSTSDVTPGALLDAVSEGLQPARDLLGVGLRPLNEAIRVLGSPYRPLTDPEGIAQQFRSFVAERTAAIVDALRAAYLADFRAGQPLDPYLARRGLTTLASDPEWALYHYPDVPADLMLERVNTWLSETGAGRLDAAPALRPVEQVRTENRAAVLGWAREAARTVRAYENHQGLAASGRPGEPVEIADLASADGILDFEPIGAARLLAWAQKSGRWPTEMPLSLDPEELGLPAAALAEAKQQEQQQRRDRDLSRRTVQIGGVDIVTEEANYQQIAAAIRSSITPEFRSGSGRTELESITKSAGRVQREGGKGLTAARRPRIPEARASAIGLAGEVAALEWLKEHYPRITEVQCWVSGYRNLLHGDGAGSDDLGYDFVVEQGRRRLMFEVKSSEGEAFEFLLTPREIGRARSLKKSERYEILFVSNVFDQARRRIHRLPNPLDPAHSGKFRPIGEGMRYQFAVDDR